MPVKYTVTIRNQSGSAQNYLFFAAPPRIHGADVNQLWSNVISSAPETRNQGSVAFEISPDYVAICGHFQGGQQQQGTGVRVSQTRSVNLGKSDQLGTSINVNVQGPAVQLGRPDNEGQAGDHCFELKTGNDFTSSAAKDIFIGVGVSDSFGGSTPLASFSPSPGNQYQIQPQQIFYIASGQRVDVGSLVNPDRFNGPPPFAVDFSQQSEITVIQDESGQFNTAN